MELDRRIIGLALVSLIISALVVFSLAKEVTDQPFEIIRNEFPSPGETIFTFALVAREDIENLQLRFSVIYPRILRAEEVVDPEFFEVVHQDIGGYQITPGSGPEDVLGNIRRLPWFWEEMDDQGISPDSDTRTVRIGRSEYDLLFHDYSRIMDHILGTNETASLQLVHGALVNSTGHCFYMDGGSAFSPGTVKLLSISHNERKASYVPDVQVSEGSEELPLSTAPHGVVEFESVKRDDTVSVVINIEPYGGFVLQIIRVYTDGELHDRPIVNAVR